MYGLLDDATAAWLAQVTPPQLSARSLLPNRCIHAWSPWAPTCQPSQPAAPTAPAPAPLPLPLQVGDQLSEQQRAVLDFETAFAAAPARPGVKEREIRQRFAMTPTRYFLLLNRLVDAPAAAAYAPVVVNRLRRLRGRR